MSKDYACGRWGPASKKTGRDFVSQRPRGVLVYVAGRLAQPRCFCARSEQSSTSAPAPTGLPLGSSGIGFSCRLEGERTASTPSGEGWAARFGESTIYCAMVLPDEEAGGRLPALRSLCTDVIVAMAAS